MPILTNHNWRTKALALVSLLFCSMYLDCTSAEEKPAPIPARNTGRQVPDLPPFPSIIDPANLPKWSAVQELGAGGCDFELEPSNNGKDRSYDFTCEIPPGYKLKYCSHRIVMISANPNVTPPQELYYGQPGIVTGVKVKGVLQFIGTSYRLQTNMGTIELGTGGKRSWLHFQILLSVSITNSCEPDQPPVIH